MNKQRAFTLVELMVVIAIIGILTTISYSSYRNYFLRSEKSLAQTTLVELSINLERYFSENGSYSDADTDMDYSETIPVNSSDVTHNITLTIDPAGTNYIILATPVDSTQVTLELASSGLRQQYLDVSNKTIGWDN